MALGTALALGIGAAVAGTAGSVIGAKAQNKAANKAADTSLAVAQQNNALAKDIYGQNQAALSPYMQRGNVAGDSINALLGLPSVPQTAGSPIGTQSPHQLGPGGGIGGGLDRYAQFAGNSNATAQDFFNYFDDVSRPQSVASSPMAAQPAGASSTVTPVTAKSAFDNYLNSTGYQFRVGEGQKSINTGYAANGLLESGAAQKELARYGQNIASDEFGRYLGYLSNQQGVGLSGASALAGVGQNYVNSVSANNNSAGTAAANAALYKGQNNANMWGGIANGIGNIFGSAYGG